MGGEAHSGALPGPVKAPPTGGPRAALTGPLSGDAGARVTTDRAASDRWYGTVRLGSPTPGLNRETPGLMPGSFASDGRSARQ